MLRGSLSRAFLSFSRVRQFPVFFRSERIVCAMVARGRQRTWAARGNENCSSGQTDKELRRLAVHPMREFLNFGGRSNGTSKIRRVCGRLVSMKMYPSVPRTSMTSFHVLEAVSRVLSIHSTRTPPTREPNPASVGRCLIDG